MTDRRKHQIDSYIAEIDKYRIRPNSSFRLSSIDTNDGPSGVDKDAAVALLRRNRKRLSELQEVLYAQNKYAVLLVLQAMDTGGKDSTIREVMRGVNPQGCRIYGFKAPSAKELSRDFLWRVHDRVPPRGHIGIFNRSHYEDVLIVKVKGFAPPDLIEKRYGHINDFERMLHDHGTRIVKVMLHISKEYQLDRLRRRLGSREKLWKFNPGDLKERALWSDYMDAYEAALNRCSTDVAPWYVVPGERRWYRNLLVGRLLIQALEGLDLRYPEPSFDADAFTPESIS